MNILAFDQSSTHVGYAIFKDGVLSSWGEYEPDAPHFDALRKWVKKTIKENAVDVVVVESIYLAFFGGKPQVQGFKVLATVKAHIWAASRDAKCEVVEVSAFNAMKALTGINKIATKRVIRKAAMIKSASEITGSDVTENAADAIGLGLAYLSSSSSSSPNISSQD